MTLSGVTAAFVTFTAYVGGGNGVAVISIGVACGGVATAYPAAWQYIQRLFNAA